MRLARIITMFNFVKLTVTHILPLIPNESRLYGLLIVLLHFGNTTVQRHPPLPIGIGAPGISSQ